MTTSKLDEIAERERLARNLLACIQRGEKTGQKWPTQEERDLARNAAHAIYLRDRRIGMLEAWLKAKVDDDLDSEDSVPVSIRAEKPC